MEKEARLRDTPIYSLLMNILSYYECPSDCHAYCCKIQKIEMDMKDLKALRNVSKTKTEGLDSILNNGVRYYKLNYPCTFLSEVDTCDAYKHRPTICRIYPFNNNSETGMFTIDPCKMGVNIVTDILEYTTKILNQPIPPNASNKLNETYEIFYSTIKEDSKIEFFAFTFDHLKMFGEYLASK